MKKFFTAPLLIICLVLSACGSPEAPSSPSPVSGNVISPTPVSTPAPTPIIPKHNVTIEVECVENLLFSQYDIDILVDDTAIGTLEHGKQDSYDLELSEGEHTIVFEKEGDSSVDGSSKFKLSYDTILKYKLSCTKNQIDVEVLDEIAQNASLPSDDVQDDDAVNSSDTKISIPQSSSSFTSSKYEDVFDELAQAGFTNIKTEVVYDVGTGWLSSSSQGDVKTISINGKSVFKKGDSFEKDSEIIITYRDFEINNPNIEYTSYTVAQLMKDLDKNALNAKEKHTDEYVKITGRLDGIDASGKYFSLYPSNDAWAIQGVLCDIKTDEQKEKVKTLSEGNNITVKGKITLVGEVLGYSMDLHSIE